MKIESNISTKHAFDLGSKSVAFFIPEKFQEKDFAALSKATDVDLVQFLKESKFTGAPGSIASLPIFGKGKTITHFYFAGLGTPNSDENLNLETLRRAIGSVVKAVISKGFETLALQLPEAKSFGLDSDYFVQQVTTIAYIASYKFDTYITTIDKKERSKVLHVTLCIAASDQKSAKSGHEVGSVIAQAVNRTRDWVDTPANHLHPSVLAGHAEKLAKEKGLKCTVFSEKEIKEMGMGGLAGVSAGSCQDSKFVILEYKSKKAKAQTIGFVGKGITFDSGGLSIKPAASMEEMKEDMAGAASVINTLVALADLQPDVNVIGFAAITENLPGCAAQKPGDIVTFYNGKTAEVRNTDAEGRLVLADALSYAVKHYKLDAVIDVATLTGACIYAVGPFFSALLSDNDALSEKVQQAAQRSGDYVWRLPFTLDFKEAVKSSVADIQNIGNPAIAAGTITAAWFLRHFTDEVPWVHLDIASTAYNVPNISYYGKGATGSSVRLLIDVAMNWKK
ncbi:MAG TPA: leucyl aminopeptidase [Candidatus Saccharimonadales bacterium]|nr:leucyl aminopeptidase [Candidatus Saccharimonadales bacterium]